MLDYSQVRALWQSRPELRPYYWGDPADVRFLLCMELSKLRACSVLDVGCGCGITALCLDESNAYLGIDLDAQSLEVARVLNPQRKFEQREAASEYAGKFHAIVLSSILECIPLEKCAPMLRSLASALDEAGLIFFTTPNGANSYYWGKGKKTLPQLASIFGDAGLEYEIFPWNPFSIEVGKLGGAVFPLFELLARRRIGMGRCVSYFGMLRKKK